MKKRSIIIYIIIIILAITGITIAMRLHYLNKRHTAFDQFYGYMNTFQNENQIEVLQSTTCYTDDVIGWFFYEKENQIYMSVEYMQKDSTNRKVFSSSEFSVPFTEDKLSGNDLWSRTERMGKNQIHAEYLSDDEILLDMDLTYQCEGSCGEYFAEFTVSDAKTGEIYYTGDGN